MGWSIARGAVWVVRGWFYAYGQHISVYFQDIEEGLPAKGDGVVGMQDQESCVADGQVVGYNVIGNGNKSTRRVHMNSDHKTANEEPTIA
jgi:hypothetical protein